MAKQVIHVSDVEAARDFPLLLAQVHAGAEIVIEHETEPVAVLRPVVKASAGRLLSESIAMAEAHARETGQEPTMDPEFAADLKEIINGRKPRKLSRWD